jgi:hypothetical protein
LQSDLKNASTLLEIVKISSSAEVYPVSKESANNGAGIDSSGDTLLSYSYSSSDNSYCLEASSGDLVYHITSDNKTAVVGGCTVASNSFVVAWGGDGGENAKSIVQTSDNGFAVAGGSNSFGMNNSAVIAKYNQSGSLEWNKLWGEPFDDDCTAEAITQAADGGVVISGTISRMGMEPGMYAFLTKLNSSGAFVWSKGWHGSSSNNSYDMTGTNDGGYVMAGYTTAGTGSDAFLVKFDSSGNIAWNRTWGIAGSNSAAYSVTQVSDDGYVITGYNDESSNNTAFLAKFDSLGNFVWDKAWGGSSSDVFNSIVGTDDGGVVAVGYTSSYGSGSDDVLIAKFDSSGNIVWNKTWGGISNERAESVVETSDGGYVLTGMNMAMVKFDSAGDFSWNKSFSGAAGYSVKDTNDNGFIVAGYTTSYGAGSSDIIALKYNSSSGILGCAVCSEPLMTITTPSVTIANPSATITTPVATIESISASLSTPSATPTVIVAEQWLD